MKTAILLTALLPLLGACGERPQRIEGEGTGASTRAPTAHVDTTLRFAGKVVLEGGLSGVQSGAVFVTARIRGQRLPALSRKYEITDPAWSTQDGRRVLSFLLTDEHDMGGASTAVGADMEVEARYDPDGLIDPRPGADEEGVVKAVVPAAVGARDLLLALQLASGK